MGKNKIADAVLEQALEASQTKERELAKQVASLQERDRDRMKRIGDLRRELAEARYNIGELNSMLHSVDDITEGELVKARKELRELKERHERQVRSIGALISEQESMRTAIHNRDTEITVLKQRVKDLDDFLVTRTYERDKARAQVEELENDPLPESLAVQTERIRELERQLEELREDERCDCAPNLALTACKKKLEQLEGMLEAQRRNTRELGVNLQRVRDEKTALRVDVIQIRGQLDKMTQDRDQWRKRAQGAEEGQVDLRTQLSEAAGLDRRVQRALSLVRRAASILDPVKVTETWDGDTRIEWTETPTGGSITVTPQAKKAEPRSDLHQCGGIGGDHHRCINRYLPGQVAHPKHHLCHCGFTWPW